MPAWCSGWRSRSKSRTNPNDTALNPSLQPPICGRVADAVGLLPRLGSADDVIDISGAAEHVRYRVQRCLDLEVPRRPAGDGSGQRVIGELGDSSASLPIGDAGPVADLAYRGGFVSQDGVDTTSRQSQPTAGP